MERDRGNRQNGERKRRDVEEETEGKRQRGREEGEETERRDIGVEA
jgi:hypothetical protein